jgi:hypothetical protein
MSTEYDIARENYQNFRYCYENGHQEWLGRAGKCIRFRNNQQWDPVDIAKLRRAGRPALTFNITESLITTMKGMQRAMRNDVRFSPVADADEQTAQVQDALWLHTQNENQFDFLETEVWERGLVTGRAYYDVRVDFDHNMRGTVKIEGLRSQDVILDPCIEQYDPETWPQVIVTRWRSLLEVEHMFGKAKSERLRHNGIPAWYDYEDELMGSQLVRIPYYTGGWELGVDRELVRALRVIERQYFKLKYKDMFIDTNTGDQSEIPESWDRERVGHVLQLTPGLATMKKKVKTICWTTTCEDVVLHEEDSPFKDFTIVPFFPKFYDGYTLAPLELLLDGQEMFNKVTSQELHIINTTANSGWKSKVGNIKNHTPEEMEVVGSKTGIYLEVEDVTQTEKITPNGVPQGHDRISMKADSIMRSLVGISNQARGFAREDVAGEAILANQAASDVNFADMLSKLHRSKQLVAKRYMNCVQDFYTETRAIMINRGSTFRPEFQQFSVNAPSAEGTVLNDVTRGEYTTILVPSPQRTSLTEDEFSQLLELRKLGIQIPDTMLIELSRAPNKAQLIQTLQGDSAKTQQAQEEMQQRIQQLEMDLAAAKAEKERSAAQLNLARAEKAHVEAQKDPDEAYERVEMARINSESGMAHEKNQTDFAKHLLTHHDKQEDRRHSTAMDLTKMDIDREHDTGMQRRDHEHQKEMTKLKPKGETP